MKAQRTFRPNPKTAAERLRERALRDKLQKEKPSLDELIRSGECKADSVMTMGMYFDVQQRQKREREMRSYIGLNSGRYKGARL